MTQFCMQLTKAYMAKMSTVSCYSFAMYVRVCTCMLIKINSLVVTAVLLPQHVCNERETQPYSRAPHGECHKGVGGRQFVMAEKSAAQIPTLMEIDTMFFVHLRMGNA